MNSSLDFPKKITLYGRKFCENMEKFNEKCKVEKGERNSVMALENIDAGEEILLENPVLVTPNWDSEIRCSNCFRESNIVCKYNVIF